MQSSSNLATPMSWPELETLAIPEPDRVNGPTNSQALLRLFGQPESNVRVTLYRDHHAWCPYCQKVWLWLEFKQIPYRIRKVTMRCYGSKESWFLKKVPSGMLPALELDGQLITESDEILLVLEQCFGPLGMPLQDSRALELRQLERLLFRAWCIWLCTPGLGPAQQRQACQQFQRIATRFEQALQGTDAPWLDPASPGSVDLIFVPYVERMNASLAYYKGYAMRREHPAIDRWFLALEALETYRGTQSDIHTHVHDLPPQMGGCWFDDNPIAQEMAFKIDLGDGLADDEACWPKELADSPAMAGLALTRVLRHRKKLLAVNPLGPIDFDQPLRCALTQLIQAKPCQPRRGSAVGLRYLRDRISVPRDMPLPAARRLRQALEMTAAMDGPEQPLPLPHNNRFDQNPQPFRSTNE
ncbi:MAG: glutathione S-transferase [Cyanobium sp. NAT70]|nr:glutathione S-transferase [Cyanobium sp. NAT70]